MIHEKKGTFSRYTITFLVALIPEFALSWVVGKVFHISIWYVWIGLQIIKIGLWILRNAIDYALFHLLWRNATIDSVRSALSLHNYPNPKRYIETELAQDFFHDVMMDDKLDWDTRLDAAQTHILLVNSMNTEGLLGMVRMNKVCMEAIKRYHQIKFSGKDHDNSLDA